MSETVEVPEATPEEERANLLQAIEFMAREAPDEGMSLREIMAKLDDKAYATFLFILGLPVCIPFLYGVPQVVAVPMLALAFQMLIGRRQPWLPEKLASRRISKANLDRMARGGRKWFGWLETFARTRLTFLTSRPAERVIAALFCIFCLSIMVPLPLTNTTPGIAIIIATFGLLARDGILTLLGLILGTVWVGMLVSAPILGLDFVMSHFSGESGEPPAT